MGIKFYCPNGHKLNVKSFLAGKKGVCPDCGVSLVIPLESERTSKKRDGDSPERHANASAKGPMVPASIASLANPAANVAAQSQPAMPVATVVTSGPAVPMAQIVPASAAPFSAPTATHDAVPLASPAQPAAAMVTPSMAVPVMPTAMAGTLSNPGEAIPALPASGGPVMATPVATMPLAAMPTAATPMPSAPIHAAPGVASPIAGVPVTAAPIAAAPISAAAMVGAPVAGMPIAAVQPTVPVAPYGAPAMAVGMAQPFAATAMPAVDPLSEAPHASWYVRPPSGGQYGPAHADVFRKWIGEGRVSADSLVWRDGMADWVEAGKFFPNLQTGTAIQETQALAEVSAKAKRPTPKSRRPSPATAITLVVTLGVLAVGLLVALIWVIKSNAN